jgi:hypothetical protein
MDDDNASHGFDWAALVPQGSAPMQNARSSTAARLDDDTARLLADAGNAAIQDGYAAPSHLWSLRVYSPTHDDFARRSDVRQECSTGCLDLQGEFVQQKTRENALIEQTRRRARERKHALDEVALSNMDDNARVMTLVSRGLNNLERCLNLHGGYLRKVHDNIDRAVDLVEAADASGRGERIPSHTRTALARALTEERLHNWSYWMDVAAVARDALLRELVYREAINALGGDQPFEAPLAAAPLSPAVRDCLVGSTAMGDRGSARSRHADA